MKIKLKDDYTRCEMDNKIAFIKALRHLTNIPFKDAMVIAKFGAGDGILTQDVVPSVVCTTQFKEDIDILQENGYDVEIIGYSYIEEINKMLQAALEEGDSIEAAILANALTQLIEVNNDK